MADIKKMGREVATLRCGAALFAVAINDVVLNLFTRPAAGPYPSYAGFAAVLASVVAFALFSVIASKRPTLLSSARWGRVAVVAFAVGLCFIGFGYGAGSSEAALGGWLLTSTASAWVLVSIGMMLMQMPSSIRFGVVLGAFGLAFALMAALMAVTGGLPNRTVLFGFYVATFALAWLLSRRPNSSESQGFSSAQGEEEARSSAGARYITGQQVRPADMRALFAALLAFGIVCGYAAFSAFAARGTVDPGFGLVPMMVIAVLLVGRLLQRRGDTLFHFAVLLVLAGLLVAPFVTQMGPSHALVAMASALLTAGSTCFAMLVWLVLAVRGQHKPDEALLVLTGGRLAVSAGQLCGLLVGACAQSFAALDPLVPDAVSIVVAFALMAYCLVGLKHFSFEDVVVGTVLPEVVIEPEPAVAVARNCATLARSCGLTEREAEILGMLARGRSGRFIGEYLSISENTVKTHIKHIYAKLGTHSRQELINLVDCAAVGSEPASAVEGAAR